MATLNLDKTGTSSANLIIKERHDVSSKTKRIFVPNKGAFFGKGLVIRDASSNKVLQPVTSYRILHMVREAVLETNKEVYAVIQIIDAGILDVDVDYHAVGGIYSNISTAIETLLGEYIDGTTPNDTIGQIVGAPIQAPPEHHIQNIVDFQNAGAALSMLEGIRKAILLGDTNAFAAVYQHINDKFAEATGGLDTIQTYLNQQLDEAEARFTRRNKSIIITDEDANPSTYTDGKWSRIANAFLYGTTKDNEVGQMLDVGGGTGLLGRKTNFFVRDDAGDGIIRVLNANKTNINEGESVTFTLTTVGLATGSKLAYTIIGLDADDLITGAALTGEFTVNSSGIGTLTVSTKRDFKTEGVEVLRCKLTNFPNVYSAVTVNDTSKTPTYKIVLGGSNDGAMPYTSVNEGDSFYITVITTDVDPGTTLYLTTGGTNSAADFTTSIPNTIVIGANGTASIKLTVKEDFLTEPTETVSISIGTTANAGDIKATDTINILDTSKSKKYTTRWSASSTGTGTISSADEGSTAYLVISTENLPQGTILNLSYSGISGNDIIETFPSSVTIYNNLAIIPVTFVSDSITEGNEVMVVNVIDEGVTVSTSSLTVNDTSKAPTYTMRYSTNISGSDTITGSVSEGDTVYAIIETTNVPNGTILGISYSGVSANDFTEVPSTTATITGNFAAIRFTIRDDFTTEGNEVLTLVATLAGVNKTSKALTITDTSTSVSGSITFSKTTVISGATSEINEDDSTFYIIYTTVDIANGTVLGVSFEGLEALDYTGTLPTTVTINSNKATISLKINKDWKTEGDQFLLAKLLLPNGAIVQNTLTIKDSSKTPTIDKMIYSTTSNGSVPVTSVTEDATVYLVIETTNIPDNTVMNVAWSGTSNADDFIGTRATTITVVGNKGFIPLVTNPDYVTETANETCIATITLPGTNGTKAATLNISDSHKLQTIAVRYNTLASGSGVNVTDVNEGDTVYAILTGTNVIDNQLITLAWSGNGVGDLSSAKPTSIAMVGNKAVVTITATTDRTREDTLESIYLQATTPTGATATAQLAINDTSKGYATATWRTGTSTTSTEVPSTGANEGDTVYLHLNTYGIPANELLSFNYVGMDGFDFDPIPSGIFTHAGNKAITTFNLTRDYTTEGTETMNLTVKDNYGNILCTTSLKVLDASKTPTFTACFATDAGGVNTFTQVDEPTTGSKDIYAVVKTTNMFNGDVVQFTFSGEADDADFSGTPISSMVNVTINNNIGYYRLKVLADNKDG